tara:strand:+ start:459 stop:908 length:450 start_codon:yes stop_codon:yes gene_type:complete
MKMNRFLFIVLILSLNFSYGQKDNMSFDRLKALKMTYITEKLGLNENQETFFWKIYNDYEDKIHEKSRKKIRTLRRKYFKELDTISNISAFQVINQINNLEHLAIKLKEERDIKLLDSLSPKKVLKVQVMEYRFNREMIYRIKKAKEEN